jgi:hypothetical protein
MLADRQADLHLEELIIYLELKQKEYQAVYLILVQ